MSVFGRCEPGLNLLEPAVPDCGSQSTHLEIHLHAKGSSMHALCSSKISLEKHLKEILSPHRNNIVDITKHKADTAL